MNQRNYGVIEGRLVRDLKFFDLPSGDVKVVGTLACRNNYKSKGEDGNRTYKSQFIPFEDYISKDVEGHGVYDKIHEGDLIGIEYTLKNNDYKDKNGVWHYELVVRVQSVDLKETQSVTEARRLGKISRIEKEEMHVDDSVAGIKDTLEETPQVNDEDVIYDDGDE